jgi:hypothetical protein
LLDVQEVIALRLMVGERRILLLSPVLHLVHS